MRKWLFLIALVVGSYLIGITFRHEGNLPKIFLIVGIVAIIKAVFFLKAKSSEKLIHPGKQ